MDILLAANLKLLDKTDEDGVLLPVTPKNFTVICDIFRISHPPHTVMNLRRCVLLYWQNSALHIAARGGHVAAVRLLLARGAEIILNKNHTSFLHEALQNGRKDVVNAVIDCERYFVNKKTNRAY